MKYLFLLISSLVLTDVLSQVNLETVSNNITKQGSVYTVQNGTVNVNQAINPVEEGIIIIRNSGRLRFRPNADITLGKIKRENGQIVRGIDGKPIVEKRVIIIEESNAGTWGADNYNNSTGNRFNSGATVNLEGVTWIQATSGTSHFDIRSGANVHFRNCEIILKGSTNFPHFASTNVTIDGLIMDNRSNATALEFAQGGVPSSIKNLELIDNNSGSTTRHFVFVSTPAGTYEVENLQARNIVIWNASSNRIIHLINPLSNMQKAQQTGGKLSIFRDLSVSAIDQSGAALANIKLKIRRKNSSLAYDQEFSLDNIGQHKERLLQYDINHGSFSRTNHNQYDIQLLSYNKNIYYNDFTLDLVANLNGENKIENVMLIDDPNISKNITDAGNISGISVSHNANNTGGTINITDSISLCDLYDFLKLDKVVTNEFEPSPSTLVATPLGKTINLGDYNITFGNNGKLTSCDKFSELTTNGTTTLPNPSSNIEISLTDNNSTYKLIKLEGLSNANIQILDNNSNTTLTTTTNTSGIFSFVTQNNSDSLSIFITRNGYTSWASTLDLTASSFFNYIVNQAPLGGNIGNPATVENQTEMIYLIQKNIQKSQGILNGVNGTNATLNISTINQTNNNAATQEKQEEILNSIKTVLLKTTAIKQQLE
ncbi:MAG: hypothetical protein N4A45_09720 [Flavobacteriales bacterium]|jgi:hypothetical protein|nr:hypothetical protein [Flavobacteriales bacterium]